jgi:hypothetical protein
MIDQTVKLVSFILFNICNLRPPIITKGLDWKNNPKGEKKPSANTDIAGSLTSSIKYNNLNEGKAISINIKAGVIVHINSINVNFV